MRATLTTPRLLPILLLPAVLCADSSSRPLILAHVTVIDTAGGPARPDATVVVRDHRIVAIAPAGEIRASADDQVVDATGKFLIPGLWDMHVHTGQRDVYLPLYVASGVTGVRDMGGDLEEPTGDLSTRYVSLRLWREAIEEGSLMGPRIVAAGFQLDGFAWPGNVPAADAVEGRQAVDALRKIGVDFVKVKSFLPREAYFAIAAEAARQNLPLAGHVPNAVRAAEATDAGQKSIEHLTGVARGCSRVEREVMEEMAAAFAARDRNRYGLAESRAIDTFDGEIAAALFARFVRNGTWQVPTLVELRRSALGAAGDQPSANERYLPKALRERWAREGGAGSPDGPRLFDHEMALVRRMHEAGVLLLAGTDSANAFVVPGFSLHDELTLLVEAGLRPLEALQAATLGPARYLGRERELGTIEAGKLADLVLLDANPLDDIRNTARILAVVANGRYLSRADLDGLLGRVEAAAR